MTRSGGECASSRRMAGTGAASRYGLYSEDRVGAVAMDTRDYRFSASLWVRCYYRVRDGATEEVRRRYGVSIVKAVLCVNWRRLLSCIRTSENVFSLICGI